MKIVFIFFVLIKGFFLTADEVKITKFIPYVDVVDSGKHIRIKRINKPNSYLTNSYELTSRPSPPFFIQPFSMDKGIETYGELEVLDFISKKKGVFIDARLRNWYLKSAIPSAVNIPFKLFLSKTDERTKILKKLGGINNKGKWDFSHAQTILLYCNGAWCGQSPTAIRALIDLGYPKDKMKYYRGGMQAWQLLGLTTIVPKEKK